MFNKSYRCQTPSTRVLATLAEDIARVSWAKNETAATAAVAAQPRAIAVENGSFPRFCRPAVRGTEGAGKTIVTDFMFAGPGKATRKLIGWGIPQTPVHMEDVA